MAVYQPSAITGNSRLLVSVGPRAELMALFYPRVDFPQNLREGMPAVYFFQEGGGYLSWTFDPAWQAQQRYRDGTNILETSLAHGPSGLHLKITDLVTPHSPALVRRFEASHRGEHTLRAKLLQYLAFQLGEVPNKNATHFHTEICAGIAYWQHISFALGSEGFDDFTCGRYSAGSNNSAKRQMEYGHLWRLEEEIGACDFAAGWTLSLEPGESLARTFVIAAHDDESGALELLNQVIGQGWEATLEQTQTHWAGFLARAEPLSLAPDLTAEVQRCLLTLDLMIDPDYGSVIAAPEFDPEYQRSGGYGYCWPRDAVEVCFALERAGYPEYLLHFLDWAVGCQHPDGYWEQRFWLSGDRAPSWCTREGRLQIDQTAAVLFAMGQQARRLSGHERAGFLERTWRAAQAAAQDLSRAIEPSGLHAPAFDLWETFRGSFAYSNAAITCALVEAGFLARTVGEEQLAEEWEERAEVVRHAVFARFWRGDIFVRGLDTEGRLDTTADAAALGLITPFPFLRLDRPEEREVATTLVDALTRRLGRTSHGGEVLLRYEGDQYAGGGPGVVPTLWLARALLCLALTERENREAQEVCRARAEASLRAVLSLGTATGMLPEMTGPNPGDMWAVPHAWSMASFVYTAGLLHQLQTLLVPEETTHRG